MRNRFIFFLIICTITFTPGCWDIRDVNNTAVVLAIGIDLPSNPATAKYKVTFEFAKPFTVGESPLSQSTVASVDADSILHAIHRVQSSVSRNISLSHLRVIVVGGDIAKQENFWDFTNYLMREPEVALRLRLVFVQNAQARDVFYTKQK